MIVEKKGLLKLAKNGLLGKDYLHENFHPSSYDLRIGTFFKDQVIYNEKKLGKDIIKIRPSEIVTMLTHETLSMPHDHCGTVFAPNSYSSSGLLILNPGHIDPGFEGPISICAINLSNQTKYLRLGDVIFTLILHQLSQEVSKEDRYENRVYRNRNDLENTLFKKRFSALSNSIFDLIKSDPEAKEYLFERLWGKLKTFLSRLLGIAVTVATILGGLYLIIPNSAIFESNSREVDYESKIDSIDMNHKKDLLNLRDSLSAAYNDRYGHLVDSLSVKK